MKIHCETKNIESGVTFKVYDSVTECLVASIGANVEGDKATLKIKTFELSDESPSCKLQLWEKDYISEDDFIFEQDITIDNDEVEKEIEFNFDVEKVKGQYYGKSFGYYFSFEKKPEKYSFRGVINYIYNRIPNDLWEIFS